MSYSAVKTAISEAVAYAAGVPAARVLWGHTNADGEWTEFPRVKLRASGRATVGLPYSRNEWDSGLGIMRVVMYSMTLIRVTVQYESERADGSESMLNPSDRIGKALRSERVRELLTAASVGLQSVGDFGSTPLNWFERELDAAVSECVFQVALPLDLTPEGGADWFNRVQVRGTVQGDGSVFTTDQTVSSPE